MLHDAIKMIFLLQTTSTWELNRFVSFCCKVTMSSTTLKHTTLLIRVVDKYSDGLTPPLFP